MNKKILLFGVLPVLAIALVVAAAVYFHSVSVNGTVNEALSSETTEISLDAIAGETLIKQVSVQNDGTVPLGVEFAWTEQTNNYLLEADEIVWDTDGYLSADFESGRNVITVEHGLTLGDLNSVDFEQYVTAGYPASVNILLDVNGDGEFDSKKDLTTGYLTNGEDDVLKIEWAYNGATAGYPDAYMESDEYNKWVRVFPNNALIDDTTQAWLYSVKPGDVEMVKHSLADWKLGQSRGTSCYYVSDDWYEEYCDDITINSDTQIYGIEIESLGWIAASGSKVRDVRVNNEKVADGVSYSVTFPTDPVAEPETTTTFDVSVEIDSGSPVGELEGTISLSRI